MGARPSRSLCSASRRILRVTFLTSMSQRERSRRGWTPKGAVETTALLFLTASFALNLAAAVESSCCHSDGFQFVLDNGAHEGEL